MSNSINTNVGAQVALRNLNSTNRSLEETQNRVSTGFRISGPRDDAAVFSVAQGLRGQIAGFGAVTQSLSSAVGVASVALDGLTQISNLATNLREKVTLLASDSLTATQRTTYSEEVRQIQVNLENIAANSIFNGINLLSGATTVACFIANNSGSLISLGAVGAGTALSALELSFAGTILATTAQGILGGALSTFEAYLATALGNLAAQVRGVELQSESIGNIKDAITEGLGALVDADLAEESATLQALQTKQQLGIQALSIANQRPQILLSLFQ